MFDEENTLLCPPCRRSFTTENRSIYRGHDINIHPAPASCKKEEGEYQPPEIKFETETSQKVSMNFYHSNFTESKHKLLSLKLPRK